MYKVKLEKFEGPLDLLHALIEAKKLDITEISLAEVADQFLDHLKNTPKIEPADLADFLVMAGRLALIKSRALLPFLTLSPEEENDIRSLKEELAEYYKFRELAKNIHRLDKDKKIFYSRNYLQNIKPVFYYPKNLKTQDLAQALANLLNTVTLPQRIPQAQAIDIISLEKKLADIENTLKEKMELKFSEILNSDKPEEKILAFLSVLELAKRAQIKTEQTVNFGEIKLVWQQK